VWKRLRAHFGIDDEEYVQSLGPGALISNLVLGSLTGLSELGSEGKVRCCVILCSFAHVCARPDLMVRSDLMVGIIVLSRAEWKLLLLHIRRQIHGQND